MSGQGKAVLVTGASGFVGRWVASALALAGYQPRLLLRSMARLPPQLGGMEVAPGDLTCPTTLPPALEGCWGVVHCAADYRLALGPGDVRRMLEVNVGGTASLLQAAARAGVARFVHCSTVGTLHFSRAGELRSELDLARDASDLPGAYKRSKWAAQKLVEGFPGPMQVVVVQPSTPVGVGDRRPTPTGAIIRDFLGGRIPAATDTGLNLVDVRAVGTGHVLALEGGRPGRSYILGDQNWTMSRLLCELARLAGRPVPRFRIPIWMGFAAAVVSEGSAAVRHRAPGIPLTAVRMAARPMYVTAERARSELGWTPGDLQEALRQAVAELGPHGDG
ncbi:MAG: NAD-dependent epimerase/dehydratase family protein [Candidatus Dormibacteraeota bacterium]|nr:NAD-dependent epimerase/dehydratase family protein [Candidatus Dormibacteraeota bacterium]